MSTGIFLGLNNELCINSSDSFPLFECDGGGEIRRNHRPSPVFAQFETAYT